MEALATRCPVSIPFATEDRSGGPNGLTHAVPPNARAGPPGFKRGEEDRRHAADGSIRLDLIERVRAQIASGTYETEARIRIAAESLSRSLNRTEPRSSLSGFGFTVSEFN